MYLAITLALAISFTALSSIPMGRTEPLEIVVPDDYPTIQEAIDNAAVGDTILVRTGTYYEHVVVNKTVSLVGEDVSATIIDGNNTGHVVDIVTDSVNITGFTVRNSGSLHVPELDAGICLNGTASCTISGNRLVGNGFAGISLLNSDQNTIICNNLSSTGWGGVHLMNSRRNTISSNNIADKYGGVNGHVSSNYNNITENVISNCTYGMFYYASDYNNICGNNISNIAVQGIWFQDQVDYNLVAENNLINNTVAIRLEGPNYNNTLSRNVITGAQYGIKIENSARYTRITDNIITDNRAGNDSWSAGIRLDSGLDSQIHSNTITGNNYGVLLYTSSPRVSIYNNTIADNEFGLRVASGGSSYMNVSNNAVMNNRGYGIGLTGFGSSSNNATITRNLIVNNSDGIALGQYSNYNTISQNDISMNDCGLYIEYSTKNIIYSNRIADNNQQLNITSPSTNAWDNGYPSGGNYWSDYGGADIHTGQYQNESGSDGIGDVPYAIDANNRDNYPLMQEFSNLATNGAASPKTIIGQGYNATVQVSLENHGWQSCTANVTVYVHTTVLSTFSNLTMPGREQMILNSTWQTTAYAFGNYTLSAVAAPIPGEEDTTDNSYNWTVHLGIPGDTSGPTQGVYDGTCNMRDINYSILLFNTKPNTPKWNPNADVNNDQVVNMRDIQIAILNFNKHE